MRYVPTEPAALIAAATTTKTGDATGWPGDAASFQATVAGTGAVTATVAIDVSNDGKGWLTLGTITLSGTTLATDGFVANARWRLARARVTAISGTDAAVDVTMGA